MNLRQQVRELVSDFRALAVDHPDLRLKWFFNEGENFPRFQMRYPASEFVLGQGYPRVMARLSILENRAGGLISRVTLPDEWKHLISIQHPNICTGRKLPKEWEWKNLHRGHQMMVDPEGVPDARPTYRWRVFVHYVCLPMSGVYDHEEYARNLASSDPQQLRAAGVATNGNRGCFYDAAQIMAISADKLLDRMLDDESNGSKIETQAAEYLGDGLLAIGSKRIRLEGSERFVVEALIELQAATKTQLVGRSGVSDAPRVLKNVIKKYDLGKFLTVPGKRGKGGYKTTIARRGE